VLARHFGIIDIDPTGYANFSSVFPALTTISPQMVLWHEEGIPRRLLLDGQDQSIGISQVEDARATAKWLYEYHSKKVRRVVVTDLQGYDRLYTARNLWPEPDEDQYHFLSRMQQALIEVFDASVAVYPEPNLDRGPVAYGRIRSFVTRELPDPGCVIFAVFEEEQLYFSFVVRMRKAEVDLVTSFDHWRELSDSVRLSGEELDRTVGIVAKSSKEFGPVACALFLARRDFDRLFDGTLHAELPDSLILSSRAFGCSNLPGAAEEAFLKTAGLFAYVPVRIP